MKTLSLTVPGCALLIMIGGCSGSSGQPTTAGSGGAGGGVSAAGGHGGGATGGQGGSAGNGQGGSAGNGGTAGHAAGAAGGSAGGGTSGSGGVKATCGDLPACVATLFMAGCFPPTANGACTKSMTLAAQTSTYTYCWANGIKLVVAVDNATAAQKQTYSKGGGEICFTATVVTSGSETYYDPAGTAVAVGTATVTNGPISTFTCTGGQPVVVTDEGSCSSTFNVGSCTADPSCQ